MVVLPSRKCHFQCFFATGRRHVECHLVPHQFFGVGIGDQMGIGHAVLLCAQIGDVGHENLLRSGRDVAFDQVFELSAPIRTVRRADILAPGLYQAVGAAKQAKKLVAAYLDRLVAQQLVQFSGAQTRQFLSEGIHFLQHQIRFFRTFLPLLPLGPLAFVPCLLAVAQQGFQTLPTFGLRFQKEFTIREQASGAPLARCFSAGTISPKKPGGAAAKMRTE